MSRTGRFSASMTTITSALSSWITRAVFAVARSSTAAVLSSIHPTQSARPSATSSTGPVRGRLRSWPRILRSTTNSPSSSSRTPSVSSSVRISSSNGFVVGEFEELREAGVGRQHRPAGVRVGPAGVHGDRPREKVLHVERREPHDLPPDCAAYRHPEMSLLPLRQIRQGRYDRTSRAQPTRSSHPVRHPVERPVDHQVCHGALLGRERMVERRPDERDAAVHPRVGRADVVTPAGTGHVDEPGGPGGVPQRLVEAVADEAGEAVVAGREREQFGAGVAAQEVGIADDKHVGPGCSPADLPQHRLEPRAGAAQQGEQAVAEGVGARRARGIAGAEPRAVADHRPEHVEVVAAEAHGDQVGGGRHRVELGWHGTGEGLLSAGHVPGVGAAAADVGECRAGQPFRDQGRVVHRGPEATVDSGGRSAPPRALPCRSLRGRRTPGLPVSASRVEGSSAASRSWSAGLPSRCGSASNNRPAQGARPAGLRH